MTQRRRALGVLVLASGVLLLSVGITSTVFYLAVPFAYQAPDLLATNITIASLAAVTLLVGAGLTYHARNFLRGRPSATFSPPSPWKLSAIFIFSLIIGQVILSLAPFSRLASLVFPPFHIAAAMAPALTILSFAGRRTRAASWRTVSLEFSHGTVLAPTGALMAEVIVILVLILVASIIVVLTPGGVESLVELSTNLQDPSWLQESQNLARLILSPATLAVILAVFVILAPLIEEFFKGLGVLMLGHRLRTQGEALLWGVACGAGFAFGESLFNGSIALEAWGLIMLIRWGASLMHCVSSGIVGLGWYEARVPRKPWRLLGAYGAASAVHALWNALAVSVALTSLLLVTQPEDASARAVAGVTVLVAIGLLLVLTISMALILRRLARRAAEAGSEQTSSQEQIAGNRERS